MQNSKKRRGISLSHHQSHTNNMQTLDKSAYIDAQTTRIQYPRYQINQTPSRHASAPKTKVQFVYPVHFSNTINSTPKIVIPPIHQIHSSRLIQRSQFIKQSNCRPQVRLEETKIIPTRVFYQTAPLQIKNNIECSYISKEEQVISQQPKNKVAIPQEQTQELKVNVFPQKYISFEQCKQTIGRRLFGVGSIKRKEKENVLRQTDRSNRWIQKNCSNLSQTSIQQNVLQNTKGKEQFGQSQRKPQLEIQREVVKYAQSKCSNENQPPPLPVNSQKKQVKKGRDPQKLQEMQKRLMEIIKICDENLC